MAHLCRETLGNPECALHLFVVHVCEVLGRIILQPALLAVLSHQLFMGELMFGSRWEKKKEKKKGVQVRSVLILEPPPQIKRDQHVTLSVLTCDGDDSIKRHRLMGTEIEIDAILLV